MPFWCSEVWCDRLVFLLQAKIPFLKKNSLFVWLFIIVIIFIVIFYDYFTSFYVKHFEFPLCYINKLASPCLYIQMNQTGISVYLNTQPCIWIKSPIPLTCLSSPGGGLLHVGIMLRAAERGDGHRGGPHPAARLWSRSWAVPLCPQRWLLHLPTQQHHLRKRRPGV